VTEIIVDNFAGGGGASTGIEMALGRSPDIAVNHDPEAVAMHAANHPVTRHFCESVWTVDPVEACGGRPVGLAWFSPDCTFHSRARGGKPFRDRDSAKRRRGLAWVVTRWARAVRPRVICLENVAEFEDWGPLLDDGTPCPERRGLTFRRWVAQLQNLGYAVEWRELRACDYGAPTTRKRLFLVARCDGAPIVWPEPTHAQRGGLWVKPWRTAAECIEWSIPCPSIFDRARPLAENTLRRIARGIRRYVIEAAEPFVVPVTHAGDARAHSIREPLRTITAAPRGEHALVAPTLIQTGYGEREGQAPRALDLHHPLGTLVAGGVKHALVAAFLAKHYGGHEGSGSPARAPFDTVTARDHHALVTSHLVKLRGECTGSAANEPLPTITAGGTHLGEVRAFLLKYYGTDGDPKLRDPLHTITTHDRFGLVTVAGVDYQIADIGMRMLTPRELFRAQGFPDSYRIEIAVEGKPLSKEAQVRMCGNSVPPHLAAAVVRANFVEGERRARAA
jgi:DNA (cytosine-5)-methyltransferase 1